MNYLRKDDPHTVGNTLSLQEDFDKIEKLSMINANARYELINANQQLIDCLVKSYKLSSRSVYMWN